MTLKELEEQLDNDLNISEENISSTCLSLGRIYQKYLRVMIAEKKEYDKLEQERLDIFKKEFHKLKVHGFDGYEISKNKSEIDVYINMNESYREISKKLAKSQVLIEYLEKTLDNINKTSFHVKNYIDSQKLKLGIV